MMAPLMHVWDDGANANRLARHLDTTVSPGPSGLRAISLPNGQRSLSGSGIAVTSNVGRTLAKVASLIRTDTGIEAVATSADFGWDLHDNFAIQTNGRRAQNLNARAEVLAALWALTWHG